MRPEAVPLQVADGEGAGTQYRLLPSQLLSAELDIQQDVLETLLSYLEVSRTPSWLLLQAALASIVQVKPTGTLLSACLALDAATIASWSWFVVALSS